LLCGSAFTSFGADTLRLSDAGEDAVRALVKGPAAGAAYDGYIVSIKDDRLGQLDIGAMHRVADKVINRNIAIVKKPEDVLKFASPEDIENIGPDYRVTAYSFPKTAPRDIYYNSPENRQWGVKYIRADGGWQAGYRGEGVNVAILDTGLNYGHEDISRNKIRGGFNWVNKDFYPADDNGHGSMVAGIIAADTDNVPSGSTVATGMAGIADKASLYIYKTLNSGGSGKVSDVINTLYDISNSKTRYDVINISLGHEGYVDEENEVIQKIIKKGTILICAAGNGGDLGKLSNKVNYPAGYAGTVGVGSIARTGNVSVFSTKNKSIDVVAPGEDILSLDFITSNGYVSQAGTSFAAPMVAAAAAMAKQRDKSINAHSFLEALKRTSTDSGSAGYDFSYGNGILNIAKLTEYLNTRSLRIVFEPAGGKVSGAKSKIVWPGGKYGKLPKAKKGKLGFAGWFTKVKGGKIITRTTSVAASSNSEQTLYARYGKKYKVSFDANGGKKLSKSKRAKTVVKGGVYGEMPKPSKKGYTFNGWFTRKKGGTKIKETTSVKLKKSRTLYAHWKKNKAKK
jgi:uncharacterized repeat protein (TIGR02543 family)